MWWFKKQEKRETDWKALIDKLIVFNYEEWTSFETITRNTFPLEGKVRREAHSLVKIDERWYLKNTISILEVLD